MLFKPRDLAAPVSSNSTQPAAAPYGFNSTFGNLAMASNGWSCGANDTMTSTDVINHSASTTTTATLTGTTALNDVVNFHYTGY